LVVQFLKNILTAIFTDYSPDSFGLNGESYLWEDIRSHFIALPDIKTEEAFSNEFCSTFKTLTGVSIKSESLVFVNRYDLGGMSGGMIDPWNWAAVILPGMVARYKKYRDAL
jgi:hypothetical protein